MSAIQKHKKEEIEMLNIQSEKRPFRDFLIKIFDQFSSSQREIIWENVIKITNQ